MRIRVKTLPLRVGVTRLTALVEYILTLWRASGEQIGERERVLEIDRCNAILILTHALRKATQDDARNLQETTDDLLSRGRLYRTVYDELREGKAESKKAVEVDIVAELETARRQLSTLTAEPEAAVVFDDEED